MATVLQIISSDNLDRTIEVMIDGKRYEYWFHGEVSLPTLRKIMKHSVGRAIQYLKKASYRTTKYDEVSKTWKPITEIESEANSEDPIRLDKSF